MFDPTFFDPSLASTASIDPQVSAELPSVAEILRSRSHDSQSGTTCCLKTAQL